MGKYLGVLAFVSGPGRLFRGRDLARLGAADGHLGCELSAERAAVAAAFRHLLQLFPAVGRLHPQHRGFGFRLDRFLGNLLGDQLRPALRDGRGGLVFAGTGPAADIAYWVFPKPVDLGRFVFDTLGAESGFHPLFQHLPSVSMGMSIFTSLLLTLYVLFAASRHLQRVEYSSG